MKKKTAQDGTSIPAHRLTPAATFTQADLDEARANGYREGYEEGIRVGRMQGREPRDGFHIRHG